MRTWARTDRSSRPGRKACVADDVSVSMRPASSNSRIAPRRSPPMDWNASFLRM